eukprot:4114081-Pyramimonas_sp.AAC.1
MHACPFKPHLIVRLWSARKYTVQPSVSSESTSKTDMHTSIESGTRRLMIRLYVATHLSRWAP